MTSCPDVNKHDQLINFRTAGVLTVQRPVRKTLFRLHLWNPRRHRVPKNPGLSPGGVSTRGRSSGIPAGDASRVHAAPTAYECRSPGGVSSRNSTDTLPAIDPSPAAPSGHRPKPVGCLSMASLNARSIRN